MSSRTVGFPESGWRPWLSSMSLPIQCRSLSADPHTPLALMVYPPARHTTTVTSFYRLEVLGCAALVPAKCREPLCPQIGVTSCGVMSCITSESITIPSSLIRAHGPDQNPPVGFGCPYSNRSLQVVVGPCWVMALPDVISVGPSLDAWPPTPVGPMVLLPVSSHGNIGLPPAMTRSASHNDPYSGFSTGQHFEAAGISLCSGL